MNRLKSLRKQGRRYDGALAEDIENVVDGDDDEEVDAEDDEDEDDRSEKRKFSAEVTEIMKITSRTERTAAFEALKARQEAGTNVTSSNVTSEGASFESSDMTEEDELVAAIAERLRRQEADRKQAAVAQSLPAAAAVQERSKAVEAANAVPARKKRKTTSTGVGGTWTGPSESEEVEMYQPKVGSWGAFPRPKDMSKAFGGGRQVGVGAPGYEESLAAAQESKLDAETAKFIADLKREDALVKEHEALIDEAVGWGQRLFAAGRYRDAVTVIENVTVPFCTVRTRIGARAILELAMCKDSAGDVVAALELYSALAKGPHFDIAKNARMLSYRVNAEREVRASGFLNYNNTLAADFANRPTYADLLQPASQKRRDRWLRSQSTAASSSGSSSFDDLAAFEVTDEVVLVFTLLPFLPIVGMAFVILSER